MIQSGRMWWGIVLILIGLLLFLDNYLEVDFGGLLRTWWPLLLVFWGIALILRHGSSPRESEPAASSVPPSEEPLHATASADQLMQSSVFGDMNVRISSQSFKGGTVSTVFGDASIDLSQSALGDGEHLLKINGVFGDTTITLPKDMAFATSVNTIMGDVQVIDLKKEGFGSALSYQVPDYLAATKKLRIQASQVFGDIVVRR